MPLPACEEGQLNLEVNKLEVPGTGSLNPEKVYTYKWTIPSGWTLNGQTSNGSNEILASENVTVAYPASCSNGTIKVRGYHTVSGCTAELQHSKYSSLVTVKRSVTYELTSSKNTYPCGVTTPITFTMTPNTTVPCAIYYWNNSTTGTTNNTFQISPDGTSDLYVTVKAVYGNCESIQSKTVEMKSFEGLNLTLNGADIVCSTGETYTIQNLPTGYTVVWDNSITLNEVSSSAGQATFKSVTDGFGWIDATVFSPCNEYLELPQKLVWSGRPYINPATIIFENQESASGNLCANAFGNNFSFSFDHDYNYFNIKVTNLSETQTYCSFTNYGTSGDLDICSLSEGTYMFWVRGNNSCGTGNWSKTTVTFEDCMGFLLMMTPNPASAETTVSIEPKTSDLTFDENAEWSIEVFSDTQTLKAKKTRLKGKEHKIKTTGWKAGIYYVRAKYKDEVLQGKLVVKK